jgi:hypothetical protein
MNLYMVYREHSGSPFPLDVEQYGSAWSTRRISDSRGSRCTPAVSSVVRRSTNRRDVAYTYMSVVSLVRARATANATLITRF